MKKSTFNVSTGIVLTVVLILVMITTAVSKQNPGPKIVKMGCLPNGEIFNSFSPNATALRTVPFLTEFGILNTNVVIGQHPSSTVAVSAMELCERIGEYLQVINTNSSDTIGLSTGDVPQKYLQEKTIVLCGGPSENELVKQLVKSGKSKVDWNAAQTGTIEVISEAFGGPGTAVVLAGQGSDGSFYAISAMSEFFKHLTGAGLAEAMMLKADNQLQRSDVQGASDSYARLVDGLRIDGTANFHAPIKDITPDFSKLLKAEVDMSVELARLLKTKPTSKTANTQLRKIAGECAYCHQRYLSYDRMSPNRVKYLYSQYPKARLETDWAKTH